MIVAALALLAVATAPPGAAADVASPAGQGASFPQVVSDHERGLYMTWIETRAEGGHRLKIARRTPEGAWTASAVVHEGSDFWPNWADFPGLGVYKGGELMAFWLGRSGPGTYSYDVWARISGDRGATWGTPFKINTDGRQAEHGFVSLAPLNDGHLGVVWLDGRNTVAEPGREGGPMTMRYAEFAPDGSRRSDIELDAKVCDCCQTAITATASGPLVAFRDRTDGEVRDISLARPAGRSAAVQEFSADGWQINACPVNGPALSASRDGRVVALAWFTQAQGKPVTKVSLSLDAGATFGPAVVVAEGSPLGRVDVSVTDDGAIVTWLDRAGETGRARVMARRVFSDGRVGGVVAVGEAPSARASGFPRFEVVGTRSLELIAAWTEPANAATGEPSKVVLRSLPLSALPRPER